MPAPKEYLSNPACIEVLLAKWHEDGLYYRVKLVSCDKKNNKSLVKFEDGQTHPIDNKDLHIQLDLENVADDKIICSLCEQGDWTEPNVITICDSCQLGYHVGCHKPPIEPAFLEDEDREWFCETCLDIFHPERKRKQRKKNNTVQKKLKVVLEKPAERATKKVPDAVVGKEDDKIAAETTEETIIETEEESIEEVPQKPAEKVTEKPAQKPTKKASEKVIEKPTKKSADKAEKVAEEAPEKEVEEDDELLPPKKVSEKQTKQTNGEPVEEEVSERAERKALRLIKKTKKKVEDKVTKRRNDKFVTFSDDTSAEEMKPAIIAAAKTLALDTKDFVAAM